MANNDYSCMIKINYDKTHSAAKRLTYAANTCSKMTAKATTISSAIPNCWKGESATAFSSEISEWIKETKAIQAELNELAADINRIANEFEEAEKRIAMEAERFAALGGTGANGSGGSSGGFR